MSLMVLHLGTETSGAFKAESVSFAYRPDHLPAFEQAYGCPVEVASSNTVRISRASWRLPLRRRDPVLRQFLELQANAVLARLSARTGFASDVQRALASRVAGGDASIAAVGREFAMSDRTLQRRLAAEGASYQELLDEARKEAAGRHLSNSTLAIGEVAYLVGYSEPAPFHRAFKRWYGMTPDVFRQKHRQAP
jgi:AraC-like DNA-binding protein